MKAEGVKHERSSYDRVSAEGEDAADAAEEHVEQRGECEVNLVRRRNLVKS